MPPGGMAGGTHRDGYSPLLPVIGGAEPQPDFERFFHGQQIGCFDGFTAGNALDGNRCNESRTFSWFVEN